MTTIYTYGADGIFSGAVEINPMDPVVSGSLAAPPQTTGAQVAMWTGAGWAVLPERPSEAPAPPEPVPASCTRREGQRALLVHGHLDDVEAAIAAISDPFDRRDAQIEYDAATWERANPFLQQMWAQLGGTPEQLDDLFRMAVTL